MRTNLRLSELTMAFTMDRNGEGVSEFFVFGKAAGFSYLRLCLLYGEDNQMLTVVQNHDIAAASDNP